MLVEKIRGESAHVRQVLAKKGLMGGDTGLFASIAVDVRMAIWELTSFEGERNICFTFRSLRTSGPIRSPVHSRSQPELNEKGFPARKHCILSRSS